MDVLCVHVDLYDIIPPQLGVSGGNLLLISCDLYLPVKRSDDSAVNGDVKHCSQ